MFEKDTERILRIPVDEQDLTEVQVEFGLTTLEKIRYGLTGELPERTNLVLRQRFADQVAVPAQDETAITPTMETPLLLQNIKEKSAIQQHFNALLVTLQNDGFEVSLQRELRSFYYNVLKKYELYEVLTQQEVLGMTESLITQMYARIEQIQGGNPSHNTTHLLLDVLLSLYRTYPQNRPTHKLQAVITRLHEKKVVAYHDYRLELCFVQLCRVTGLSLTSLNLLKPQQP